MQGRQLCTTLAFLSVLGWWGARIPLLRFLWLCSGEDAIVGQRGAILHNATL
jgi:hypothetical protein